MESRLVSSKHAAKMSRGHLHPRARRCSLAIACLCLSRSLLLSGLNSSPHLVSLTERFRLNGVPIPDALFLQHFWAVWDGLVRAAPTAKGRANEESGAAAAAATSTVAAAASSQSPHAASSSDATVPAAVAAAAAVADEEDVPPIPSHFRFLTLVAYHLFLSSPSSTNDAVPECVILEVGLGGKLDATNIVSAPIAVGLSSIGFDHMEVLGYTLEEIAREKAGIIKTGVAAFSTEHQTKEVKEVLSHAAEHERASLQFVPALSPADNEGSLRLGLAGAHQYENAGLACALAHQFLTTQARLHPEDDRFASYRPGAPHASLDLRNLSAAFRRGLEKTSWPGRCQRLVHPSRELKDRISFYIDGAHTDASMRVATAWFQEVDSRERMVAAAAKQDPPARYVLLFNCGHVRDPIELMLPLAALQYPRLQIGAAASSASSSSSASAAATSASSEQDRRSCAECDEAATVFCSDCFRCLCAAHDSALHSAATLTDSQEARAHTRHRLAGVSFSHLVCAPFDHDRPHFSAAPSFEKLLRNYLLPSEKRSNFAVAAQGEAAAAAVAAGSAAPAPTVAPVSPSASAPQIHPLVLRYLAARFDFPSPAAATAAAFASASTSPAIAASSASASASPSASAAAAVSSSAAYIAAAEASIAHIMQECPAVDPTMFPVSAVLATEAASPSSPRPPSPSDHSGSWQRTLFRVWRFLHRVLQHEEARLAGSDSADAAASTSLCVYAPSVAQALQGIQQLAEQEPRQHIKCMVTGSLYIVGNVLDKLHYQV